MRIRIEQDIDPESPREWDPLGKMVCFHKRGEYGDDHDLSVDDFCGWDGIEDHLRKECEAWVVLPVYMYSHGSVSLSTEPFSCPWDSGQLGFIYATRERAAKWFGGEVVSEDRVRLVLQAEIESYDQWLNGDVWGYIVEDESGEQLESCWGFYGREAAQEEAEEVVKVIEADRHRRSLLLRTPACCAP